MNNKHIKTFHSEILLNVYRNGLNGKDGTKEDIATLCVCVRRPRVMFVEMYTCVCAHRLVEARG